MEYGQLKQSLNQKRLLLSQMNKNLETTVNTITELYTKRKMKEDSKGSLLVQKKESDKERILRDCSQELEEELSGLEDEMSSLRLELKEQLEHYSLDKIKSSFFRNSPLSEETQAKIKSIKSEAGETISPRFVNAYFASLGKVRVSEDDFLTALDEMSATGDKFFNDRDNKINSIVKYISNKAQDIDVEESENTTQNSAIIAGMGVVAVILSVFIFPIYSIFLCITSFVNFKDSYNLKNSLDLLKIIEDNFRLMEKALAQRAIEEYEIKKEELNDQYSEAMAIVQQDIDEVNNDITLVRQQALADFVFDGSKVEEEIKKALEAFDHEIAKSKDAENAIRDEITVIESEISALTMQYNDALNGLLKHYVDFTRVGDSKFYPENILLTPSDPPEFFKNPAQSHLFIYQSIETTISFIKLFCLQLRCNMAPPSSIIEIWDPIYSGVHFMSFRNPDPKGDDGGFRIINNKEGIKESLESLTVIFQKRMDFIRIQYKNIADYNTDMVKLNSVTENYMTIFVMDCDGLAESEDFKRLLNIGPDIGIYIYIFIDKNAINEKHFPLLERINKCILVKNEKFVPNAVDAIMSSIKAAKERK